jgi:anaerobic dimethyl sulfoxide reductase subunit A
MGKRQEIPPIPKYIAAWEGAADDAQYPLQLIGWHWGRRCHTVHDNNAWLEEMDEPRLWLNPVDAKVRRIADGDMVEVFNRRGKMKIKARVTVRIMIGVAAVPQGGWHTAKKDGEDVRGSINVLTSLRPTPLAKGNAQHTMRVEVKKI